MVLMQSPEESVVPEEVIEKKVIEPVSSEIKPKMSVERARALLGLPQESSFLPDKEAVEEERRKLVDDYIYRSLEAIMKKGQGFIDSNCSSIDRARREHEGKEISIDVRLDNSLTTKLLKLRGLDDVDKKIAVLGKYFNRWGTAREMKGKRAVQGLNEFTASELDKAIERFQILTGLPYSGNFLPILVDSESVADLKYLAGTEETAFNEICQQLNPYYFVKMLESVVYKDGDEYISPNFTLLMEIVKRGGLKVSEKERLDKIQRLTLLKSSDERTWPPIPKIDGKGEMSFSDSSYGIGLASLLSESIPVEILDKFVYLAEDFSYQELRDESEEQRFHGVGNNFFDILKQLYNENSLDSLIDLADSGLRLDGFYKFLRSPYQISYTGEALPKSFEQVRALLDDQERLKWMVLFAELKGVEPIYGAFADDFEMLSEMAANKERMFNLAIFLHSLAPDGIELGLGDVVFYDEHYTDLPVDFQKILLNIESVNIELLSSEERDFLTASKWVIKNVGWANVDHWEETRKSFAVLVFLAQNKDRAGEFFELKIITERDWRIPVKPALVEAMLRGEIEVEDEELNYWIKHCSKNYGIDQRQIDSQLFFQNYDRFSNKSIIAIINSFDSENIKSAGLSQEETEFWLEVVRVKEIKPLADFLIRNKDRWAEFYKDGNYTYQFINMAAAELMEDEKIDKIYSFLGLIEEEEISQFSEQEKILYTVLKRFKCDGYPQLINFLFENKDKLDSYFTDGQPTHLFIEELAKNKLWNAFERGFITSEVVDSFPQKEDRNFWRFFLGRSVKNYALMNFLCEKKFSPDFVLTDYLEDGKPTDRFLTEIAGNLGVKTAREFFTDEVLADLSKEAREYWSIIARLSNDVSAADLILKSGVERGELVADGRPTLLLFELIGEDHLSDYAVVLLKDDVLNTFPTEVRPLWEFIREQRSEPIRNFLFKKRDDFNLFVSEYGKIQPLLIQELVEDVENSGDIRELISSQIDKFPEDPQNRLLIDAAIKGRVYLTFFPPEYLQYYPDYEEVYERMRAESIQEQWADVIDNPESFWNNNTIYLVHLLNYGFSQEGIDFRRFRSLVNNQEIISLLKDAELSIAQWQGLRGQLGLRLDNLSYVSNEAIKTVAEALDDEQKMNFYRHLLNEKPRCFITAVNAIAQNPEIDIGKKETQQVIMSAIADLGNITPIVLKRYVAEEEPGKRIEFAEKVKEFKQRILRNLPIKGYFEGEADEDLLLAEFITLSFPGTTLYGVRERLPELKDRCSDLDSFFIAEAGYEAMSTSRAKIALLKKNKTLDYELLEDLKNMFPRLLTEETRERFRQEMGKSLHMVLKRAGALTFAEIKEKLPSVLSILYEDEAVIDFRKTNFDFSQHENVSVFLSRARELLGIYFKDNFRIRLTEVLENDGVLKERLARLLSPKRLNQISRNLGAVTGEDKDRLESLVETLKEKSGTEDEITAGELSALVTFLLEHRILSPKKGGGLRRLIKREFNKFEFKTAEGLEAEGEEISFMGFVSKNAASFFAKDTAGICTAGDMALFNRPDHFHVNLVGPEGVVVGNIQGYVFTIEEGRRALLFRGFNPSVSFVNPSNVDSVCEGMVSIVRQFAQENGIEDVFIAEQLGSWHALTNRVGEGVYDWFKKRHLKAENEIDRKFPITRSQTISKMYRI